MKVNWGTAIVLAFIGFIAFIMYFVISMNIDDKYNHDLVTDDYYQQELKYQEDIDKVENAKKLLENISWEKTTKGILLNFPNNLRVKDIKGKVFLYRPSNKQLDFDIPISLSNRNLLIPDNRLLDGRWNIKIDWSYNGEAYMFKDDINY
ncbi:FixH family protein [Winogradskyella haliclonae]|uniref:Cytochrome Cbb3 oxidase maturation protein CcoH n=1 Tax=Winogradskyella haliclonae TaxID=2048558 RepID=A0ABQ2BZQ5_9FLAO|nr:FixH family protein [Winogradskyella haliclonae]GGI57979.1 cytochrome Cbb3 oxidase maturation protein CcoH [Winogradskyella haliclonae]